MIGSNDGRADCIEEVIDIDKSECLDLELAIVIFLAIVAFCSQNYSISHHKKNVYENNKPLEEVATEHKLENAYVEKEIEANVIVTENMFKKIRNVTEVDVKKEVNEDVVKELSVQIKTAEEDFPHCNDCENEYEFKSDEKNHAEVNTSKTVNYCHCCGKKFTSSHAVRGHMKYEHIKPRKCKLCKNVLNGSNLPKGDPFCITC